MSKRLNKPGEKVARPPDLGTSYPSVKAMAADLLGDDPEFVAALEAQLRERQLVKSLAVVRARAGLSQAELADKLGCSQSKVSKMESGLDADVKFGEFGAVLDATGYRAKVLVFPAGGTLADEVESHAREIKHLLDKLVAIAGTDGVMVSAVADFIDEAAVNLLRFVTNAAQSLPNCPQRPNPAVEVETPTPDALDEPKRTSRTPRPLQLTG